MSVANNWRASTTCLGLLAAAGCVQPTPMQADFPPREVASQAQEFSGSVIQVADGDTLTVRRDGEDRKVHLSGVDCPELKQPFGRKARQFTADAAIRQEVTVKDEGGTRDGGVAGTVTLPDGRILNQELVRSGLCWWERQYAQDEKLPLLEAEAHAARTGLWSQPEPVPPWEWRKMKVKPRLVDKEE